MRDFKIFGRFILIGIGFSFAMMGCNKEPQSENFVNINDKYEIMLQQELSPAGGLPTLHISSVEPQECTNSYISHHTVISPKRVQLFLHEILTEGECIAGSEYISEDVSLEMTNPQLAIEINLKNVIKNDGTLYTNEYDFNLDLNKFDGLKISKTKINRILPGMIWGSYKLSNESVALQLEEYINDSDQIQTIKNGDFGHFYVSPDKSIVVYQNENEDHNTFLINNKEDFASFESKILEFKELANELVFQATNFDGSLLFIE